MKTNYLFKSLFSFWLRLSLVFFMFITVNFGFGQQFEESDVDVSYDICDGKLTVELAVPEYDFALNPFPFEGIVGYQLYYNETPLSQTWKKFFKFNIPLQGLSLAPLTNISSGSFVGTLTGTSIDHEGSKTQETVETTSSGPEMHFTKKVVLKNLPDDLFGQDTEIKVNVFWKDCSSCSIDEYNQEYDITIGSVGAPTNLVVSSSPSAECGEIDISWTNPDINGSCPGSTWEAIVERQLSPPSGSWVEIANVGQADTYTDTNIPNAYIGEDIGYRVRVEREVNNYRTDIQTSETEIGNTIDYPDAPLGIQASTGRCDGIVEVTWDIPAGSNPASYQLQKKLASQGASAWSNIGGTLPPSPRSYEDAAVIEGNNYVYRIKSKDACDQLSQVWTVTLSAGSIGGEPGEVSTLSSAIVPSGVRLTWSKANNTNSYVIERTLFGGGGTTILEMDDLGLDYWAVNPTTFRTIDESVSPCQLYQYSIRSINACSPNGELSNSTTDAIFVPDLTNSFVNEDLISSTGYYSDRVELTWTVANNENFIEQFKIYRKVAGSQDDSIVLITLNSGSNIHNDFLALAGVMYKYTIVGESLCDQTTIYTNPVSSIGFRSPFGTVSGQVSYTGGIAVENVKISASSSSGPTGKAIALDGSSRLQVLHDNSFNTSNGLNIEFWMKPSSHASNFTLLNKNGSYNLKHIGAQYVFTVFSQTGSSQTVSVSDAAVGVNNYNHLTASLYNDTLRLYVNGNSVNYSLFTASTLQDTASPINLGYNYQGLIDEFRFWNVGKSAKSIQQDFSRQLDGGEAGLKIYLKMNEGTGIIAYDFSRTGITNFHKNNAYFIGSPSWSGDIPTSAQLAIASFSDAQGNYVMNVPYSGTGETFILTPSYLTHVFDPSTRALFIGEGSSVFNNIDFTDISSFTVQGSLFYENTTCAVQGATLLVDGNPVVSNGTISTTDAQGNFLIQVPIGEHYISVEKQGHYMNVGRFPETGTYNFQDDLAGLSFKDSTVMKVVGRVVGGLKEASYIPGLGKSNNNIGTAQIIITSQQGNGCYIDTILTDANTGEYTTYLPPLRYVPTVHIPSNPTIDFGVLDLLDLSDAPALQTFYDTVGVSNIDSVQLNKQVDYIYREDPQIIVKDKDGVNDFIGDTTYTWVHPNGDSIVRNLRTNPLAWPVFAGIGQEPWYTCLITAYEQYINLETNNLDTVPTTDGTLVINNDICIVDSGELELSEINTLDSLQYLYYRFKLGTPNFNENLSIPQYNFVKTFEVNLVLPNGANIAWKPDVFSGIATGQFNAVYDDIFRGYVLGTKSDGAQFITAGPQVPEYVLRDPPGSNSSSTRSTASTKTTENSWNWSLGGSAGTEDAIYLGTQFTAGIGLSTETDIENNNVAGFSASVTGGNSGTEVLTITNTQDWGTNANPDLPGAGSDLFIGKSKNVTFGISKNLKIVPDSICTSVECIGNTFNNFSFANTYGLSIVPGGYETQFIYNQNQITSFLIPDLINFRNALLQSDPRYVSNLPINAPNYGKNNDDIAFNPSLPSLSAQDRIDYLMNIGDSTYTESSASGYYNSITQRTSSAAQQAQWDAFDATTDPGMGVLSGQSYTFLAQTLEDSLTGDSVRWINNQIRHWEDAIMLNEWEKVKISDATTKNKLKEVELTKLIKKYKESIKAFEDLAAQGGIYGGSAALNVILAPYPGAALLGYAEFAITTSKGIEIAEVYDEVLQFENQKAIIESKYLQAPNNYSISGGNTFTASVTHESASTYTNSIEYGMSASLELEIAGKVGNVGAGFKKSLGVDFSSGRDWSKTTASSETVSFTLDEPDQGDYFSVDMFPSLLGWGPVFKLRPGGATSCPYEGAELTQFYTDGSNASFELGESTLQVDKPTMTVAPSLLTNVPITNSAVFNLTINNESEAAYAREYKVAMYSASNPFGALVSIDGASDIILTIPAGSSVNKVLSVNKGPGPVYDYDSLLIVVYPECDPNIIDSVYVSAHFLPTCTEVEFATPDNLWVLNNSFQDTLPVAIIDYDINFFDFESIRLDYKPSSSPQWVGLKTFYRDTSGLNNPTALEIPTNVPFTLWDWQTDQIVDGDYDLRLVSECTLVDKISPTHSGLMDRINPHPFGTPSPADGILDPDEDILIRFNEPIDLGSLTSLNFDVRGVINGSETTHASNLYFDGIDDYVEVTGGTPLQRRDFTLEFSVKRGALGQEAIMSQGPDGNEQIYVGFDSGNHLECRINGQSVNSLNTYVDNDWHFFAVAYSYDNETVEIFEASANTTAAIVNTGNVNMYAEYEGDDKFFIGKDLASGSFFTGNLDDVRVWNTTRSLTEFALTKALQLSSNEPGLLYNWRFDEAEGIFAKDHVRSRDGIIYGAEWTVEPGGSAITLDGVDDYVRIEKGDVNITQGMDYTLEFWFNSTQTDSASLVSTGLGDGLAADSLFAWNIAKDDLGNIHVYHNGEDFEATTANYFDGEWHHFALVLNRLGNLTSYVDGNLENSVQATPFKDLGGPAFYLGARGYYTGTIEVTDNYFDGSIDEFRFWDASRKFEQVARDKNNRMKGDEYALRIYMPFEDYQLDPTGVAILTPGLNEQIDATNHPVTNPNGAVLTALTPKIKLQRPVESIAFTYSVNNDEIIITPTTNQALIENVTLDITVKNVKDLHGNVMESPKTWIAYMDKNQVVWQDDLLTFDKAFGANLSFSSSISNEGGAAKNYTIENIPDWLTITPTSGIIQPNSQLPVSFTVDPNVNIGDYSQDIQLLTDFGFPEKLTIDLKVREEEPNWTVNPADYTYSMSINGYLKIRDVVSTSEEDILAVFVNDECRGLAHLQYVPQLDRHLAFLSVYSNVTNGEDLSFKIWDASSGTMFTEVEPTVIPFQENSVIGTAVNPQLFETNYEIAFDVPLVAGWNWIGHFLFNQDSTDLDLSLESLENETGDEIKTLTHGFSSYLDTVAYPVGWSGDINGQGIRPELGYKLKVSKTDTLVLKGDILDPTSRTINLTEGWNWIGFISIRNQSLAQALGNHNPSDGDLIKSKAEFSIYYNSIGWLGDLDVMTPGAGYMYKSADTVDFVYPFAGMFKSGSQLEENVYSNATWTVDRSKFASNMTAITQLNSDCEYLNDKQNLTLGVFDNTGIARGISPIEMHGESGLSFTTVSGLNNEGLGIRILDNSTLETYTLNQGIDYVSNAHLGSISNPYEINISEEICFKMQADAGVLTDYFKVYPTIIEDVQFVDFISNTEEAESKGFLYNIWGQKIWEVNLNLERGFNRIELDLNKLELAPGIYHFVLESNGTQQSVKLISK